MDLKCPTPKRKGNYIPRAAQLPILCNNSSFSDEYSSFGTFSGYFNSVSVIVDDPEEIKALYTMGCFGKASFSKGFPNSIKRKNNDIVVLKEHQWERRKEWAENMMELILYVQKKKRKEITETPCQSENSCPPNSSENNDDSLMEVEKLDCKRSKEYSFTIPETQDKINEILVIKDCREVEDLKDLNPHIEHQSLRTAVEVLYLTLEEAFFLSYALGCLQIKDLNGHPFTLEHIWNIFSYNQEDFIENYVAYHYFRAKGWVVKSGLKYGGRFLLYKEGPAFYHASYIVLIENIAPASDDDPHGTAEKLTWDKMNCLNRLAESCNKEIIICRIKWPQMTMEEKENPSILKKFKVKEYLLRRWQACQEKVAHD